MTTSDRLPSPSRPQQPRRLRRPSSRRVTALAATAALFLGLGGASAVAETTDQQSPRHRVVATPDAPAAIGPYSQGISAGNLTFVSGQLPIDPRTRAIPAGASVEEQTRQVLRNVEAVLEADGMSMSHVVSTTVYLADLDDFARFNAAYAEYFGSAAPPARATVEVARVPRDAKVEISAIAVR